MFSCHGKQTTHTPIQWKVRQIGAWASSAALLVAGLAAFRHSKVMAAEEKPSWFRSVLKSAQLANSIWQKESYGRCHA
jgi:hypothetical protein